MPKELERWVVCFVAVVIVVLGLSASACSESKPTMVTEPPTGSPLPTAQPFGIPAPTATVLPIAARSQTSGPAASAVSSNLPGYLETVCNQLVKPLATWGDAVIWTEETLELLKRLTPPEELRDYIEASFPSLQLAAEHFKQRDPDEPYALDEEFWAFTRTPKFEAAQQAIQETIDAMSPELMAALDESPC